MAQVWTTKQLNFINRVVPASVQLMADLDNLTSLANEFADNAYGSGGANALTDGTIEIALPAATAAIFDSAMGAVSSILATAASNRGYLEAIRP